jgi:hypothetical protein
MTIVSVFPPSSVVAVMVADPIETTVTIPVALTVATAVLFDVQVMFLFDAFAGAIVAASCCELPTLRVKEVGVRVIPVTGIVTRLPFPAQLANLV